MRNKHIQFDSAETLIEDCRTSAKRLAKANNDEEYHPYFAGALTCTIEWLVKERDLLQSEIETLKSPGECNEQ